jgi:ABC-type multidrug transport system fused ATPase/permease subunit
MPENDPRLLPSELRWLSRQARPLRWLLGADFLCMIAGSGLSLLDPLVVKWLIDVALPKRDLRLALLGTLVFCLLYLASMGATYATSFVSILVTQKMVFRIRVSLLRQVHRLPAHFHENSRVGETLYRIEQDVERVAELSADILPLTIETVIMGIMVTVTMAFLNWHLTTLVLPILPVFYFLQKRFAGKLKQSADRVQNQSGKMSAFLQEHLSGLLQLLLLNRIQAQNRRFARLAAEGARLQIQQRATEMAFGGASVGVVVLGVGLILGYGGYEVVRGALTIGGLVAFYGYIFRLFAPLSIAIDLQSRLQRVGASVRRIMELNNEQSPRHFAPNGARIRYGTKTDLEFRSVCFSYSHDRRVLRNMTFRVEAEETVALVGLNGSGKSTIGLLATGLYQPDAGSIFVAGHDLEQIGRRHLRTVINLVPQDPVLFDETIRQNLLYANPDASSRDLDRVANLAHLGDVLKKLPRGLDEPLGPLGGKLSGGEKKRLALARALLQQPRILILDEVTNSLDAPTAAGLLDGLDLFRKTRTLIVVSHRPSTILWADRILVVDKGIIVDSGKHQELMQRCAAYQAVWESQYIASSPNGSPATVNQ